jgi:hypothetical protein
MEHFAKPFEVLIPRGTVLRIRDGAGMVLETVAGSIWVTQEGDIRDFELNPGDSRRFEQDGLTLVHALRDAQLRVAATEKAFAIELGGGFRKVEPPVGRVVPAKWIDVIRARIGRRLVRRPGLAVQGR